MKRVDHSAWLALLKSIYQGKAECYFCHNNNILEKYRMKIGSWQKVLVIHHISADALDNDKSNLLILCKSCHKRLHLKIYAKLGIKSTPGKRHTPYFKRSEFLKINVQKMGK